ncbi:GNAT family N-acetyltransferase [Silvanigrella aquatica]|uniref:N-acetyltransferase domain-containing protein n=1 Tax=Silvanigrella aquatica TaxID=1915309 RepID=A0A1L4D453_9BACT|nr:GNAT family protein [Silvanigrella aquatica]APJ04993.1 hypothetical protein AXG55_14270 [Silvanigrella aquatica]
MNLHSKRISLRPIENDDAQDIFEYGSNINVSRYMIWNSHKSIQDSYDYIKSIQKMYKVAPISNFGITVLHNGKEKLIGTVGLFKRLKAFQKTYELGYVLNELWWGKGYAYEACNLIINYGFKNFDIHRIEAHCVVENKGSMKVMEKLGMQREGIIRQNYIKNEIIYDLYLYSLLKSEWNVFR